MTVVSSPHPLGVTLLPDGTADVAVYSETADSIAVVVVDESGAELSSTTLGTRTGHVFHGVVDGLAVGSRYGLRVDGPWSPADGLRHNAHKLLVDPYARAIAGTVDWNESVFSHLHDEPETRNDEDSAPSMIHSVVVDDDFDWGDDAPPRIPLSDSIVYEVHVKGFTARHPDVDENIRGTYAGLGHPAAVQALVDLGVTAVELLPIHQFVQDSHLLEEGRRNYWGYNSIGFLAPHNEYSHAGDTGGQVNEFKSMVKALHAAGIEVILDVVYNHTAEGNHLGPTLSLKGIDNRSYYRLVEEDRGSYFDTTGTGNSLNVGHPAALALIMDSLRYWVTEMHVDGFRFDLASTLTRQDSDLDKHSAFLDLVHQDPTLASVKLIAEPWDTQGYQVGGFPARWSEWNGKFRDDVRDFWRSEPGTLGAFAQRITGSPDVYESTRRPTLASVNFVTAHDGFTLADLNAYDGKHNDANGEDNQDGESDNRSWGCGAEGPTDDEGVLALRARQQRNHIATLLLSAGVPMILGGDEIGRTQHGNNNAYCQDNELSWFDWDSADTDLLAFTRELIELRKSHAALRPTWFRHDSESDADTYVDFYRADGEKLTDEDWSDGSALSMLVVLASAGDDDVFGWAVNASSETVEFGLPSGSWRQVLSSDPQQAYEESGPSILIADHSFTLLAR
ncbi:glycogen debranching protein GlgX [Rhodococcoides fascians]|uniref:glycogen debranching protein GlgX n=1 Tax=Rhodococcoides fascians TaxID=1828 RepID=UPI000562A015|nr:MULTISPECIES: glycogen debranching protein GlgX [Rhodococcus]OZF06285.1 glycogen debranching enzyme [Rhodococcus sp. 15-1189-1-1a]OZF21053.1 glycogen debranching enzyme [Rhodococcus sp. 14-2686-1-2]